MMGTNAATTLLHVKLTATFQQDGIPDEISLLVRGNGDAWNQAGKRTAKQAVLDAYSVVVDQNTAATTTTTTTTAVEERIGSTVRKFKKYCSQNATIVRLFLRAPPLSHHGGNDKSDGGTESTSIRDTIQAVAHTLVHAVAANQHLDLTVVRLEQLDVTTVLDGHDHSTAPQFAEQTTFILDLRDMLPCRLQDLHVLHHTMQQLSPHRLGIQIHGDSVCDGFWDAVLRGAGQNPSLFLLGIQAMQPERATVVAQVLNTSPFLQSLGFNKGALTEQVAKVFVQKLEKGCAPRKLSISEAPFDEIPQMELFSQLVTTKWTCLTCLDVSCNTFTYETMGMLCETLVKHETIKTLIAKDCQICGGALGAFTTALGRLFHDDSTLETITMDNTNLFGCDAPGLWEHLVHNKTLTVISLKKCFGSPRAWLDIFEGVAYACRRDLNLQWRWKRKSCELDMNYSTRGKICFSHSIPNEQDDTSAYDWVLRTVRQMHSAPQQFQVPSHAACPLAVSYILPQIMSSPNVTLLDWEITSKNLAIPVLIKGIPTANPSFSSLRVFWPRPAGTESSDTDRDEIVISAELKTPLSTDLEQALNNNRSLLKIDLPAGTISTTATEWISVRNQVASLNLYSTPLALLPIYMGKWPAGKPAPPSIFRPFIAEPHGKRATATFLLLQVFAERLDEPLYAVLERKGVREALEKAEAEALAAEEEKAATAAAKALLEAAIASNGTEASIAFSDLPPLSEDMALTHPALEQMKNISLSSPKSPFQRPRLSGRSTASTTASEDSPLTRQNGMRMSREMTLTDNISEPPLNDEIKHEQPTDHKKEVLQNVQMLRAHRARQEQLEKDQRLSDRPNRGRFLGGLTKGNRK